MKPNPLGALEAYVSWGRSVEATWRWLTATDDGMELLLLLRHGFQDDFVGLLLPHGCNCSRLIKRDSPVWRVQRTGSVYSCHDARVLRVS
jgi:hypothetical protein